MKPNSKPMLVLGMMSGTSADGIDAVVARISGAPPDLRIKLVGHTKHAFAASVRKAILRAAEQDPLTPAEFSQLHARLGAVYADAALTACKRLGVSPQKVALIGNHGQTIFHRGRPLNFLGAATASTLQIGDGAVIAARTGIPTVSDFRPADMALGGQGAPLVPYADYLLWRHATRNRVALNIGGIANLTALPAGAKTAQVFAFDTGPGNMLIDALVAHFTRGRASYDRNARLALQGKLHAGILNALLRDPYLKLRPPKSTGREYFGRAYVQRLLVLGRKHHVPANDLVRTATVFTAVSIVAAIRGFVLPELKRRHLDELIVSGGGANNPLLLGQIAALLPGTSVMPSSALGIPVDAKEALAFALLAYETWHRRPSNVPSATGASGRAILGKLSYAPPH
ncbi:MAG TPA: anhydro-N-acetylmuramic acid kinase [Dongiaceae bacterium]|nr:anhydro-N-acetylmuramic acid kinase [Dongiaceae bacterium]